MYKPVIAIFIVLFSSSALVAQDFDANYHSRYKFYAGPEVAIPVGRLDKISRIGYGATTGLTYNCGRFEPGLLLGFLYFDGIEEMTQSLTIIPLLASGGYRFMFTNRFYCHARIAAGGSAVILRQDPDNISYFERAEYETKTSFDFMTRGGLGLVYMMAHDFRISLASDYAVIVEHTNFFQFFTAGLSAIYLF